MKLKMIFKRILGFLKRIRVFLIALFILISMVFIYFVVDTYRIDLSELEDPAREATVIYDIDGEPMSELSSARFTAVSISDIPEDLINGIIAVEDQRFFSHNGVDYRGIVRSAWRNARAGSVVEGGSTITQQLAKNLFLTSDRTYARKFQEVITAYRIEREFDKEEIMELYLNHIYFGEGTWGIQNASQVYFGKDVQEITLEEGALLAALPKAPTHYSPFKNEEKAKERRDLVLYLLMDQEFIDDQAYEAAKSEEIVLRDFELEDDNLKGKFPGYVDFVIDEAINVHGLTEERIWAGDMKIYTEMDPVVQTGIQTAFSNGELFPETERDQIVQGGSVVLDPYTGGVRGLVGYRGDHVYRGFNRATQLKRQPGSAIKPLAVFAPALEMGYTPSSTLVDEEMDFDGYSPKNIVDTYQGSVSLYEALIDSINVPAVWLLNEMGVDAAIDFLQRSNIPLHEDDRNLSIALGGFTEGTSPLHLAQAFSMFPNLGEMNQTYAIKKITGAKEEVLAQAETQVVRVMEPENAYTMTEMLQGVVQEGTGGNAALDRPTAGKTGTTQLPPTEALEGVSGVMDAWFVGYTPELVTAVWIGFDKMDPEHVMNSSGSNHPARLFQAIMSDALEGVAVSEFNEPEEIKGKGKEKNEGKDKGEDRGKNKDKDKDEGKGKGKDKDEDKGKGKGKGKDK